MATDFNRGGTISLRNCVIDPRYLAAICSRRNQQIMTQTSRKVDFVLNKKTKERERERETEREREKERERERERERE